MTYCVPSLTDKHFVLTMSLFEIKIRNSYSHAALWTRVFRFLAHFRTLFIWHIALHRQVSIAQVFKTLIFEGQWSTLELTCKIAKELCSETFISYLPQKNIQNNIALLTALCLRDGKVSSTRRIAILGIIVKPCSVCSTLETRASDINSNVWWFMISVNTSITVGRTPLHLHLLPPNKNSANSDGHLDSTKCEISYPDEWLVKFSR